MKASLLASHLREFKACILCCFLPAAIHGKSEALESGRPREMADSPGSALGTPVSAAGWTANPGRRTEEMARLPDQCVTTLGAG